MSEVAKQIHETMHRAGVERTFPNYRAALLGLVASDPRLLALLHAEAEGAIPLLRESSSPIRDRIVRDWVVRGAAFVAYGARSEAPCRLAWLTREERDALAELVGAAVTSGAAVVNGDSERVSNRREYAARCSRRLAAVFTPEFCATLFDVASRVGAAAAGVDMLDPSDAELVAKQVGLSTPLAVEAASKVETSRLTMQLRNERSIDGR